MSTFFTGQYFQMAKESNLNGTDKTIHIYVKFAFHSNIGLKKRKEKVFVITNSSSWPNMNTGDPVVSCVVFAAVLQ